MIKKIKLKLKITVLWEIKIIEKIKKIKRNINKMSSNLKYNENQKNKINIKYSVVEQKILRKYYYFLISLI